MKYYIDFGQDVRVSLYGGVATLPRFVALDTYLRIPLSVTYSARKIVLQSDIGKMHWIKNVERNLKGQLLTEDEVYQVTLWALQAKHYENTFL